jgi:hypothetical protein
MRVTAERARMASAAAEFPRDPEGSNYLEFPKEPGPWLRQQLLGFTRKTARPEQFPGLHPGPIPADEPFVILGNIDVEKSRRPAGDRIPCAMCTPNRFYQGKFIYVPRLRCVTIIGHCCADKEVLDSANQVFDAKQKLQSQENYLLKAQPLTTAKLAVLKATESKVFEVKRLHKALKRGAEHIVEYLRNIKREGGRLTVDVPLMAANDAEWIGNLTNQDVSRYKTIEIGTLKGLAVSLAKFEPERELASMRQVLTMLNVGSDQDEVFYFVAELSESDREERVKLFRNVDQQYSKFSKRLADFAAFFEPENIALLNRWGNHRNNSLQLHAQFENLYGIGTSKRLRIGNYQGEALMIVSKELWKQVPAWEYVSYD